MPQRETEPFAAYPDRGKIAVLILLSLAMVAMSAYCVTVDTLPAKIAGYAGVVFFSICFLAWCRMLAIAAEPRVVIDDRGITPRGGRSIPWCDIQGFHIASMNGTKFLSVNLHDPERYLSQLSFAARYAAEQNAQFGVSVIAISFVGLTPGLDAACEYLRDRGHQVR